MKFEILRTADANTAQEIFARAADWLLNSLVLKINEQEYRITEIEFYLKSPAHPDLFTHCSEYQSKCGFWYFHRIGHSYRGGSFKGVDISFGGKESYGGVLLRSLEKADGTIINGPSLLVDHMLNSTSYSNIAKLDGKIEQKSVFDTESPIHLREINADKRIVYSSARVGLSLKKVTKENNSKSYILNRYRFLSNPKGIKKGKAYLDAALFLDGKTVQEINAVTGTSVKNIEDGIKQLQIGRKNPFENYIGKSIATKEIWQLHGTLNL